MKYKELHECYRDLFETTKYHIEKIYSMNVQRETRDRAIFDIKVNYRAVKMWLKLAYEKNERVDRELSSLYVKGGLVKAGLENSANHKSASKHYRMISFIVKHLSKDDKSRSDFVDNADEYHFDRHEVMGV